MDFSNMFGGGIQDLLGFLNGLRMQRAQQGYAAQSGQLGQEIAGQQALQSGNFAGQKELQAAPLAEQGREFDVGSRFQQSQADRSQQNLLNALRNQYAQQDFVNRRALSQDLYSDPAYLASLSSSPFSSARPSPRANWFTTPSLPYGLSSPEREIQAMRAGYY